MNGPLSPGITAAEPLHDGVLIRFGDGKAALYPAELLHASLDLADIMAAPATGSNGNPSPSAEDESPPCSCHQLDSARVIAVRRFPDGVFIEFDNGRKAIYPARLLYAIYDMAMLMNRK